MSKPIIAIDIDDVLAANAAGFVAWSNERFETNLTVEDYQEHWAEMWKIDREEAEARALEFHESDHVSTYQAIPNAREALERLREDFKLILLTSRRTALEQLTREWIDRNYPALFDEFVFCGFYDTLRAGGLHLTKADHAKEMGAAFLIDDQLKHIEAAAESGITGLLFGEYAWNRKDDLPPKVRRVRDWQEVLSFFREFSD